ncbi:hypothetical protein [uncultured Roseobacter sp.]|uniref:hypothetical protein n=1 Tax=uncultured Roseobacter sp. TaxID=114847 RepID=UPI00262D11FE|nr:hypothetical protein [uncultured Roseobacter sp.]
MSDLAKEESAESAGKSQSASKVTAHDLLSTDWEDRLAEARAKRQKLLEAKGKSGKKPVVKRPRFMDEEGMQPFAPVAPRPMAAPVPDAMAEDPTPAQADPAQEAASLAAAFREEGAVTQPPRGKLFPASIPRVATVAFACFFGLGFGMVLSFGAVVGMGWVSLTDVAPQQNLASPDIKPEAPSIFSGSGLSLPVVSTIGQNTDLSLPKLTTVQTGPHGMPRLFAASAADNAPAEVLSPGPRLNIIALTSEPLTYAEIHTGPIDLAFASPVRGDAVQLLTGTERMTDALPVLPEVSNVKPLTFLASLNAPIRESQVLAKAFAAQTAPIRMPVPQMYESMKGDPPATVWSEPLKLDVFYPNMVDWASIDLAEPVTGLDGSQVDVPPIRAQNASVLPTETVSFKLPDVGGPPISRPDLAFRLGFRGDKAAQFSLVTFAPTNVKSDALDRNAEILTATGFPVASVNRVNFKVSKTHVRYYSPQDEQVAQAVAAEVGGIARDFTGARNSAPPGRIEVWMAGNRAFASTNNRPKRTPTAAQRRASLKAQLENRLVNSLRRGEHLGTRSP